eukprot:TRINITY_DN175_c1_g1_i2.p1 TRINITY_DN175_c1_g1~~TRINITY_DN175_c1_g1_i2.p1  ORF type:complete len:137 (+),score=5.30 TRINITY_DN175_c1_g1_i2:112-522(+)
MPRVHATCLFSMAPIRATVRAACLSSNPYLNATCPHYMSVPRLDATCPCHVSSRSQVLIRRCHVSKPSLDRIMPRVSGSPISMPRVHTMCLRLSQCHVSRASLGTTHVSMHATHHLRHDSMPRVNAIFSKPRPWSH